MNVKYQQTSIKVDIVVTPTEPEVNPSPAPDTTSPFHTSSACCSTLEQKQDACVSYLKQQYKDIPNLEKAMLMYS